MRHDLHVHTTFSDGSDDLAAVVAAAERAGLQRLGISDHVRRSTCWLPSYVGAVRRAARTTPLEVLCGVEAKILDVGGRLDLPGDLDGLDYVLIADHRMPTASGPLHPAALAAQIADGAVNPVDVIETLVQATANAADMAPLPPVVAHLFSLLPKLGLVEAMVPQQLLRHLGNRLRAAGAAVELNEKWACPSRPVARALHATGVALVAGSDSHRSADVGRFHYVQRAGRGLIEPASNAVHS